MAEKTTIAKELERIQDARDMIRRKLGPLEMGLLTPDEADGGANLSKLAEKIDGINVDESSTLILDGIDGTATLLPGYYKNKIGISVKGSSGDYHLHGLGTITPTESVQTFNPSKYVSAQHDKVYGFSDFTVAAIPKQYGNVNKIVNATDEADYILAGNSAIVKGVDAGGGAIAKYVKGSMANHGKPEIFLSSTDKPKYLIQAGYYSGGTISLAEGTVTTTDANALASEILSERTAYVQGQKITGTILRQNAANITVTDDLISLESGYYPEGVTKTLTHGALGQPQITIDGEGVIHVEAQVSTGGYLEKNTKTSNTRELRTKAGTTITPTKERQTAIDKETFALGPITVAPIPDEYQYIRNVSATSATVLKGYTFVDRDGKEVEGTIRSKDNFTDVILSPKNPEYRFKDGENPGYYHDGSIKIQPEETRYFTPQVGGQTISPADNHILSEVYVYGVEEYLGPRVNVTASQVVFGAKFVDQEGTPMTGTMPEQKGNFKWNYKEYEEFFPIPAGAYSNGQVNEIGYDEWTVYDGVDSGTTLGDIVQEWEEVVVRDEDDNWIGPIPEFNDENNMSWFRVYIPNIPGNGQIISIENYGVSNTPPGPIGPDSSVPVGRGGSYYRPYLVDGTLYLAWYDDHPNQMKESLWIYNYTYGTPSAYVTMPDLVDALAAI